MNQKNVVGIGNIYASESLYLAQINPNRVASDLTIEDCKKITLSAKKILNAAIKVGGTTLKDFYSADGSPGYFKFELNAYGREGLECKKCKTLITKVVINTRATFFLWKLSELNALLGLKSLFNYGMNEFRNISIKSRYLLY